MQKLWKKFTRLRKNGFKRDLLALPQCKYFHVCAINMKIICTCEFLKNAEIALAETTCAILAFWKNSLVQINSNWNLKPYDYLILYWSQGKNKIVKFKTWKETFILAYLQDILSFNSMKFCVDYIVFCFQSINNLSVELNRNQRTVNFINFQEHAQNILINFLKLR